MHSFIRAAELALLTAILLCTAVAQNRPAKHNKDFNPLAVSGGFNSFTTGAVIKIKTASIAKDGTITARFSITDANGNGLDVTGAQTPGIETLRFVAAYIPNGQAQYVAYTTTTLKSASNSNPPQVQAGTDTGGKYNIVDAASGTYDYVFGTKAPANFDASATHSIGAQIERDLSAYGYDSLFSSDDVFSFVPNGSPVTNVRDVINEASCNSCHNPLSAHGGSRKKMSFCVLCHTPQSTNPDSQNTVDMKVFIHKLHMGSSLPTVKAGGNYYIFHRGAKVDYSTVVFPQDIRNCTTCHAAGPAQADNWKTQPSQAVCGSCHDDVNFQTGLNHVNLPQVNDNQCKNCHRSDQTLPFDASIPGAHLVPNNSPDLPGIVLKVLKVENATAGNAPTVTFQVTDKAGNPVDITALTTIRMVLAGNNVDYGVMPTGMARVSETPTKATPTGSGTYVYTMTNKIPATATGSFTVSLEAANTVTLMGGTTVQTSATDSATPMEYYFSVDNSPVVARRQVVSMTKCNSCHQRLTFVHGGSRPNTQECVMCHNPTLTDGTSKQSVSFATQIHSIHRGEALANPYVLGTTNYQEVRFPGDLRDCATCHLSGTYQPDNVGAQAAVANPGGFVPSTGPIAAACQGCHDDKATAAHALSNTTALGEACLACHGNNAAFAVDTVHARVP
ncbi:MAG TPA: OmcA/MtrC family decaheme c-type cytochrome [Bryobacteraceae bacterium]|nr:OmcA/MtrC family decaheme c-type cytochrome [Bryobacteraceae bacterium]